ncbi:serine hydrolase domain-containing protein [Streptomyces sp. NPDC001262]|uniref:serine hydrolase domain-containing protein n=1 Tax=unclassified Streptomyces TaxID=2593676 RepID=UPI0036B45487
MSRTSTALVSALLAAAAVVPAAAPAAAATPDRAGGRTALQQSLDAVVAAGVPGAMAEVRDEHGTWRGSSGIADIGSGRHAQAGDKFRAGSVTKSFVATVVLQLVAEHKLGLDDAIEQHLPGLVPNGEHITVRQLLAHTSGLADYLTDVLMKRENAVRDLQTATYTPRDLVAIAAEPGPKFAPGTSWSYSNTNYVVLGLLIEKTTGHSLGQEIGRRIVRPLHLTGTSFPTTPMMPGAHLNGYEWFNGPSAAPTDTTEFSLSVYWGAGTLISTTHDLNTFYRALGKGKLLPPALQHEMYTMRPDGADRPGRSYGLGLEGSVNYCAGSGQAPVWGHTGSVAGYNTFSFTTADGKRQVTLSLNQNISKTEKQDEAAIKVLSTALCRK